MLKNYLVLPVFYNKSSWSFKSFASYSLLFSRILYRSMLLGSNASLCVRLAGGYLAPVMMKVKKTLRTMMKMLIDMMQSHSAKVYLFFLLSLLILNKYIAKAQTSLYYFFSSDVLNVK